MTDLDSPGDGRWALSTVVTERFLNSLVAGAVGDGVVVSEFRQHFVLPMLGAVDVGVGMTIVGVEFTMIEEHSDRLHAVISAAGNIRFYGDAEMPEFPGPARVRGEVLVRPVVELGPDGAFRAVLDLAGSELVGMAFDGIDGMPTDAGAQEMMGQMLFATLGGELFTGLAHQMGSVGIELAPEHGRFLAEMGVAEGPGHVQVHDGALTVALHGVDGLVGHAAAERIGGERFSVGVASGALGALANRLIAESLGSSLPFEFHVTAGQGRVGGHVRNQRLVQTSLLPDLRPGLRYTVRPELAGDQLRLSLREAWVELPLVPPMVNRLSRWVGGVASVAPITVTLPAHGSVPVGPTSAESLELRITELDVAVDGVTLVIEASL